MDRYQAVVEELKFFEHRDVYKRQILMLPLLFTHITVMEIKELRQDSEIFRKFVMESLLVPE